MLSCQARQRWVGAWQRTQRSGDVVQHLLPSSPCLPLLQSRPRSCSCCLSELVVWASICRQQTQSSCMTQIGTHRLICRWARLETWYGRTTSAYADMLAQQCHRPPPARTRQRPAVYAVAWAHKSNLQCLCNGVSVTPLVVPTGTGTCAPHWAEEPCAGAATAD